MPQKTIFDTIIIGAGWSSATAARELTSKGYSVLVLEARDRIGGRAKTWVGGPGGALKVDVGCSFIHGYKEGNPVRALAKELGVNAHLPKAAEGAIYGPDGPLSSSAATALRASLSAAQASFKLPYPAPPTSASLASALFSSTSPLLSNASKPDPSSDITNTSPADPTLAQKVPSKNPTVDADLAKSFARTLEVPLGLKLEKASLRWAGWETITSFAGSDAAPEAGYEALVKKVFESCKGLEIKLSTPVTGISGDASDKGTVTVKTDGGDYEAKTVISTIPLGSLKELPETFFSPALPAHLKEVIKGTHVGVLEKLLLHYAEAWWPNSATTGSYTLLPTSSVTPGPNSSLEEIFAGSTLTVANMAGPSLPNASPTLLTYLSETPATLLLKHEAKDVAAAFHKYLASRFKPSSTPAEPTEYNLTDWLTDPLSRGATTTPSIVSENGERSPMDFKELSRPVWAGRLGFAGEHTEMEHRGSVAGAAVSGTREGQRVVRFLSLQNE